MIYLHYAVGCCCILSFLAQGCGTPEARVVTFYFDLSSKATFSWQAVHSLVYFVLVSEGSNLITIVLLAI